MHVTPSSALRALTAMLISLGCTDFAGAQPASCSLLDQPCLDQEYPRVCLAKDATFESCSAWLGAVEKSPSADVRSMAAAIYSSTSERWPERNDVGPAFRARAAEIDRAILAENPNHTGALLGLSVQAASAEERVLLLRRVVAADPTNVRHLESLARALGLDEASWPESAGLLERAYELQIVRAKGNNAWRFARDALSLYQRAGLADRATALRERVASDFGLAELTQSAANAATTSAEDLDRALERLCAEMTLSLFGPEPCLAGIDRVVEAADRAPAASVATRLAESASKGIFTATTFGAYLDAARPTWRHDFESTLERYLGPAIAERLHDAPSEVTVE